MTEMPALPGDGRPVSWHVERAVRERDAIWVNLLRAEEESCRSVGNYNGALAIMTAAHAVRGRIARGEAS